ncbi:MAG: protein kinase [Thermoanaerobaculia bacterium]
MTVAAGSRLGPYEVLSPLGSGGMGEVWRARDSRLSREVAIKVLPAAVASDTERLKRFEKEARAASALNHPSIVTIYDVGVTDGVSWIAMELVEGKTLRELLVSGALPAKRLLQLATSVADGLARAHEAGIVHRDLKPENVMVTKDGLVKILDFGLAKTSTGSGSGKGSQLPTMTGTTPGVVVGTVGYMSPEQASGEALDFRSDQFSFGSMLYEMATGKRAFQRKTAIDTLGAILNMEPEPIASLNPQVPAPLRWIVERCLAKEARQRYASSEDLARELASLRDHMSEASFSDAASIVPQSRRKPWAAAIASAVALALGLLAGKSLWKTPPPSLPRFQQLTFADEAISSARFAPDGQTVVYGASREGKPVELFSTRVGAFESRSLGLNADIRSISSSGEMAIVFGPLMSGKLAVVPLAGGAPRELLEKVMWAEWSPDANGLAVLHLGHLEFPIGKVLLECRGCGRPRFSRGGDRILLRYGDSAVVADTQTGKLKRVHEGPVTDLLWSTVSDDIWMSQVAGSTTEIHALKPGGAERLVATLPGTFILQDITAGDRILAERVLGRNKMLGQVPGETREKNLSWLNESDPADISADGKTVLFDDTGRVYLRRTDGSPAIHVGNGRALALSPDGKWVLSRAEATLLLPTGAGQSRTIAASGIDFDGGATFSSDGKRLLLSGTTKGGASRLFVMDAEGGEPRPVTPDGVHLLRGAHMVSPDGKFVVAQKDEDRTWSLYPIEGGPSPGKPIPGISVTEQPTRWSADGRSLFVWNHGGNLSRLDLSSDRRNLVKELPGSTAVSVTPDGRGYVYAIGASNSNLWLIDGLKP